MFTFLLVIHSIICVFLIGIVLLQSGKGAEMGAAFGGVGQAQNIRSAATFISKLTTSLAILFMITSTSLAYLSSQNSEDSVVNKVKTSATIDEATKETEMETAETKEVKKDLTKDEDKKEKTNSKTK